MDEAAAAQQPVRRKIVHLQALRAVAASAVVVDHAIGRLITRGSIDPDYEHLAWFFGWLGVATFFVISGLIMIRTASEDFGSPYAALDFCRRRIIRVIPLYWIATAVYVGLRAAQGQATVWAELIQSLFFIPYHLGDSPVMRPVVGQGWTLNFEMFFYACFALCLLLPRKRGILALLAAFPLLVLAGLIVRPLFPYADPITKAQFWTDPIILLFELGVIIGLIELSARRWHVLTHPLTWSAGLFGLSFAVFHFMRIGFPLPVGWQMLFGLLCAGTVVLCTSAKPHQASPASHILEKSGDASFSTYLFHPIILTLLSAAWDRSVALHDAPLLFILVAVIASNITGYLIHLSVERPVVRWMGQMTIVPRADAAKAEPAAPPSPITIFVMDGGDDFSQRVTSEPHSAAGTL